MKEGRGGREGREGRVGSEREGRKGRGGEEVEEAERRAASPKRGCRDSEGVPKQPGGGEEGGGDREGRRGRRGVERPPIEANRRVAESTAVSLTVECAYNAIYAISVRFTNKQTHRSEVK